MDSIEYSTQRVTILIVDDSPTNLTALDEMLSRLGYHTHRVTSSRAAIFEAENKLPDLVVLSASMAHVDSLELCRQLRKLPQLHDVPVIFVSSEAEALSRGRALGEPSTDYITTPFQFDEVRTRVCTQIHLQQLRNELELSNRRLRAYTDGGSEDIPEPQMATVCALARLAEARDTDVSRHLDRVREFCRALTLELSRNSPWAKEITPSFVRNMVDASQLHDIGKVAIRDSILLKPGLLTADETELMCLHTTLGAQTIQAAFAGYSESAFVRMAVTIAMSHHERWDGRGYPHGLSRTEIPLAARIMAVADVYDALRSSRCYKPSYSHADSTRIILSQSDTHFDPYIVRAFGDISPQFEGIFESMKDAPQRYTGLNTGVHPMPCIPMDRRLDPGRATGAMAYVQ